MPEYKLTYLNIAALGEPIRLLLKAANVPFEDERIELADWVESKKRFPLGQVPILTIDGKELTQSYAILRYLGQTLGYVTSDAFLNYRIDQAVLIVEDLRLIVRPMVIEVLLGANDPQKVEELRATYRDTEIPRHLKQIESIVAETDGNFTAGSQVTYGDFVLANWFNIWERIIDENMLDNFPALKSLKEATEALPGVKEWIEARPKTYV